MCFKAFKKERTNMKNREWTSKTFWIVIFIAALSLSAAADNKTDRVDKLFAKWDSTDSPGASLAIIQDGKIIYRRGYGMANLEHDVSITPKTVFRIGSTSKQFTAACIAILSLQGKISLDDDIRKYLPEVRCTINPSPSGTWSITQAVSGIISLWPAFRGKQMMISSHRKKPWPC
jgi:CubicO group peptidase (beta-lactamase class C family)